MNKTRFVLVTMLLTLVSFTMLMNSCKKSDDNSKSEDLIGTWVCTTDVGEDGLAITTVEFMENGMAHIWLEYSIPEYDDYDGVYDFTLPYEVVSDNMIRFCYDYKDKEDYEYVEYVDDYFEIKEDRLIFTESLYGDEDGEFYKVK